jgi:hypothetical protein
MKKKLKMTEGRALALLLIGGSSIFLAVMSFLKSMQVSDESLVLVFALTLVVGSYLTARIVVHYSEKSSSDRR